MTDNKEENTQAPPSLGAGMELFLDIQVAMAVEIGKKMMKLRDVLKLTKGTVIELDKLSGDPLDIVVNGALVARGEVVVINEKYGIRITEIAKNNEALKK